ncbi:hypothetical protein N9Y42_00290 [Mariniblastus sp.]|nr:hypothetical protein [Mariniblastus sp.]
MKNTLKTLIAFGLFATLFSQSVFAQQIQLELAKVKTGDIIKPATELIPEAYTVNVPYTENVTQTYQVQIPYTENVKQTYTIQVPYTETVTGEDGEEKTVQKMRTEQRERMVPVKRKRTETKTKQVPVQRMRTETKIRQVPRKGQSGNTKPVKFPSANAKFAYVSGEKISNEKMKELATETLTILQLPAGQTLSDLQRQILRPDLIVMTMPAAKAPSSEKATNK